MTEYGQKKPFSANENGDPKAAVEIDVVRAVVKAQEEESPE